MKSMHLEMLSEDYRRVTFAGQYTFIITEEECVSDRLGQAVDGFKVTDEENDAETFCRYHQSRDDSEYEGDSD